ncbi:hypothetical protein GCM10007981_07520 [Thermocladium modestius]|uniref:Type II methyltransferase n=1 Tax=Thermocladium modestius TaxID=62609 RepID=A0A830GSL1_9CREN|nr:DNA methyltransferase [Thermocladium modestius]GGP20241.1 hypothetical protein GCM10007981_07520 [Thermocladium modestius]
MVLLLNNPPASINKTRSNYDVLSWSTLDNATITRWLTSVWDIQRSKEEKKLGIQRVMPMELINRLIMMYSKVGDVVVDPFMGSGSTLASAYVLIRKGVGFEIYDDLVNVAVKRLKELEEESRGYVPLTLPDRLALEMDSVRREVDHEPIIIKDDARNVDKYLERESVDIVLTAPPLFNPAPGSLRGLDPRDLALITNHESYMGELGKIIAKLWTILRRGGFMIMTVEDMRAGPIIYPLHVDLITMMKGMNFSLRDIIIWDKRKEYDPKSITGIVHEYIIIMEKS